MHALHELASDTNTNYNGRDDVDIVDQDGVNSNLIYI